MTFIFASHNDFICVVSFIIPLSKESFRQWEIFSVIFVFVARPKTWSPSNSFLTVGTKTGNSCNNNPEMLYYSSQEVFMTDAETGNSFNNNPETIYIIPSQFWRTDKSRFCPLQTCTWGPTQKQATAATTTHKRFAAAKKSTNSFNSGTWTGNQIGMVVNFDALPLIKKVS